MKQKNKNRSRQLKKEKKLYKLHILIIGWKTFRKGPAQIMEKAERGPANVLESR